MKLSDVNEGDILVIEEDKATPEMLSGITVIIKSTEGNLFVSDSNGRKAWVSSHVYQDWTIKEKIGNKKENLLQEG